MPPDKPKKLCTQCGIREATNFIHQAIDNEPMQSAALCNECLPTADPAMVEFIAEAKKATCRYCGGTPCMGQIDTLSVMTGKEAPRWLSTCMPCTFEHLNFMRSALSKMPPDLTPSEQMKWIEQITEQAEAHMIDYVKHRDN